MALLVVDGRDHVGVAHVVHPGHVLVADPLDAVRAEAVREQRRALQRLGRHDLHVREPGAQVVAGRDGAGRARGRDVGGQPAVRLADLAEDLLDDRAGHGVVPGRVPELLELVEDGDLVAARLPQLPALVVDLLDVRLGARRRDDLVRADGAQPLEALLRHALGQDGDGLAAEQRAVEGAAAAVVPGRGPDRLVQLGVELARDQARHQAAEGGADLVGADREVLADQPDDAGLHAGQLGRELDPVAAVEQAALLLRLVLPGDAEEVERVDILHARPRPAAS